MSDRHRTFIIGLTGNIATGKSAVLRMAAERGALTLDADRIVHQILDNDPSMQAAIAVAFGEHLRRKNGSIDRAALGAIVFEDEQAMRDLEHLVHPAVRVEIGRRIERSDAPVVVLEAIKLLEGDLATLCDQIWVTRCPRELQKQRLIICRGMDAADAETRIAAQNPQEAKVARAHVVIDTHGTLAQTFEQFDRAWRKIPGSIGRDEKARVEKPEAKALDSAGARRQEPARAATQSGGEGSAQATGEAPEGVIVRRARPSDIPALLLLMRQASAERVKLTRAEMLMSFSQRSYLIGQRGTEVVSVVGWHTDSTTAVCVDQVYAHPPEAISAVGPAMLQEIESSAQVLICEVVLAFVAPDAPAAFMQLLRESGYQKMTPEKMRRAWQQVVGERVSPRTVIMGKILRDVRVV